MQSNRLTKLEQQTITGKAHKRANVQCDNDKPFSSGGLALPAMHLASVNQITAFRMLNFILRAKDVYLLL